jgi:hypothetical protein
MKTKVLLALLTVASLALTQPATAATRSFESIPATGVQTPAVAERTGAAIEESDELRGRRGIWAVFVALGLAALLVILLTGEKSPG